MRTESDQGSFVGRTAEISTVRTALQAVDSGSGITVVVEGEAGIGKSRLLAEALEDFTGAIATARGSEIQQSRPFGLMLDALAALRHPHLSRIRELIHDHEALGEGLRYRIVDEISDAIEESALSTPTVLVLDDLHWADSSSCLVIDRLSRLVGQIPLSMILATRPATGQVDLEAVLTTLHAGGASWVHLSRLDASEATSLSERILGGAPGPHLQRSIDGAKGNPLFIIEYLTALDEEGALLRSEEGVESTATEPPPNFRLTVLRRVSTFRSSTIEVLRAAALLGNPFRVGDLVAVHGLTEGETITSLEEAINTRLIMSLEDGFAFAHDLIRDAIYHDMAPPLRERSHRAAARSLRDAGAELEQVAAQLSLGAVKGDEEAVEILRDAARELRGSSPDAAVRFLTKASEITLDDALRGDIETDIAQALIWLGRSDEAEHHARKALALAQDEISVARVRSVMAEALYSQGRHSAALSELTLAAGALPEVEAARARARLLLMTESPSDETRRDAEELLAEGRRLGDEETEALALCMLSVAARARGLFEDAANIARAAIGLAERGAVIAGRAHPHLLLAAALFHLERYDAFDRAYEEGLRFGESIGNAFHQPMQLTARAIVYGLLGRWDEAEQWHRSALATADELGLRADQAQAASYLAAIRVHRGDLREAKAMVESWHGDELLEGALPSILRARALVAHASGDTGEAQQLAESCWEQSTGPWTGAALLTGNDVSLIMHLQGDEASLKTSAERARAAYERGRTRAAEAMMLRFEGLAARDPAQLQAAATMFGAAQRLPDVAGTLEQLGRTLLERGIPSEAIEPLSKARDLYEQLDASWDVNRVSESLRLAGAPTGARGKRGRPKFGWESLTPAESAVVELVVEGLTNKAIAERLFISRKTVENHLGRIFDKLQVRSRVELATTALGNLRR